MGNICIHNRNIKIEHNSTLETTGRANKTETPNYQNDVKKIETIQVEWRRRKKDQNEKEALISRVKVLESNLTKLGEYIPLEEVKKRTSQAIRNIESKLKAYTGTDQEKSKLSSSLINRKPFKYKLNNLIYHGYWSESGFQEGYGILIREDGSKLEGLFKEGNLFKGRIFEPDGSYYEGDIKENEPNGQGTFYLKDKSVYSGSWKNGMQIGEGERRFSDNIKYSGSFKENEFQGQGKMLWPDGSSYEGNFEKNIISGRGVFRTVEGDQFIGEWSNSQPIQGKYTYSSEMKNQLSSYEGSFKNGKKHGKGKLQWNKNSTFTGEFQMGQANGPGIWQANGRTVKGIWRYGILAIPEDPGIDISKDQFEVPDLKENFKPLSSLPHLNHQNKDLIQSFGMSKIFLPETKSKEILEAIKGNFTSSKNSSKIVI
jgi:hypothetical protein